MSDEGTVITKMEDDEIIDVSWKVYFDYLREGFMWVVILCIAAPLTGVACWCWMTLQYLTAEWMDHFEEIGSFKFYFWKFFIVNIINIVCLLGAFFILRIYCLIISN